MHGKRLCAGPAPMEAEEEAEMPIERMILILLTALCVLNGLVFIEVRRVRMILQKK